MSPTPLATYRGCPGYLLSMRRFHLHRDYDPSGISGTGCVAQGVEFDDGRIALVWLNAPGAIGLYACISDMLIVHGHDGTSEIVWEDEMR